MPGSSAGEEPGTAEVVPGSVPWIERSPKTTSISLDALFEDEDIFAELVVKLMMRTQVMCVSFCCILWFCGVVPL